MLRFHCFSKIFHRNKTIFYFGRNQDPSTSAFNFEKYSFKTFLNAFHTTVSSQAKSFQERENEHAHRILEKKDSYIKTLADPQKKEFIDETPSHEFVRKFIQITVQNREHQMTLEELKFTAVIDELCSVIPLLTDGDILNLLHHLCLWPPSPKSYSPNFKALWNTLDYICTQRMPCWGLTKKLLFADYWFYLRLSRITKYNRRMIDILLNQIDSLTDSQVIQLMFYINLQRIVVPKNSEELEKRLFSVVQEVSLEEIGIICLAFFKTENKVKNFKIIQTIMERFVNENSQTKSLTVEAILKFLKKSMHLYCTPKYLPLLYQSTQQLPNWDVPTSIHLALLASECHVYHPYLLHTVTEKVISNIENIRLKDCMKLLQVLSHFDHRPPEIFYDAFNREIQNPSRLKEREKFPRDLVYSTLYNAYLGYYNYNHINTILHPQFISQCVSLFPASKFVFAEIDYCVAIECPDYSGERVSKEYLSIIKARQGNKPEPYSMNIHVRNTNRILAALQETVGNQNVLVRHVLPHCFSPDIVVRTNNKVSESLSSLYGSLSSDMVLKPPVNELWSVYVITAPFFFCFESKRPTGTTTMKLRQLGKLGYNVVFLPFYEIPTSDILCKKLVQHKLSDIKLNRNRTRLVQS